MCQTNPCNGMIMSLEEKPVKKESTTPILRLDDRFGNVIDHNYLEEEGWRRGGGVLKGRRLGGADAVELTYCYTRKRRRTGIVLK